MTVAHEGRSTGVLVSWVQQAAFDPPAVTVVLKRERYAATLVQDARCFVLNVIGEDPTAMFKHFGKGFGPDDDAFAGLAVEQSPLGPKLPDAIAHLGCRLIQKVNVGDHELYVAEVVAGDAVDGAKPYVHIRTNGLSY